VASSRGLKYVRQQAGGGCPDGDRVRIRVWESAEDFHADPDQLTATKPVRHPSVSDNFSDMDSIEIELRRALEEETGRRPRATDPLSDLGLDSLRMAELATRLEDQFGVRVDEELLDVDTVADLTHYIRSRTTK
jgi:acyl carrier protein